MGQSGLGVSQTQGVGAFIESIVRALDDAGVDWAPFDRSGDGYVDILTVLHPTAGGGGNRATDRVWSHRWNLEDATNQRLLNGFETSTPRANGPGNIRINDYTIQPLLACSGAAISEIGTFAHEMGHAFGLCHIDPTRAGLEPTFSVMANSAAGRWTASDMEAIRLVYGAGLSPADPRQRFVAAGLIE